MINTIINGDCLEIMRQIPHNSIDLILTDLPFGFTQNKWDKIIEIDKLWTQYRRIIKENGAILLFGFGLFSAKMIIAANDIYKYSLIWYKNKPRGFLNAKKQPLRVHENIDVFYKKQPIYNPQKTTGHKPANKATKINCGSNYGRTTIITTGGSTERYPGSVLKFKVVNNDARDKYHPTQKPVALGEYLIKTYSNEGNLVLDNTCGSGSFLVAAKNTKRNFIGIEIDPDMVRICNKRINGE